MHDVLDAIQEHGSRLANVEKALDKDILTPGVEQHAKPGLEGLERYPSLPARRTSTRWSGSRRRGGRSLVRNRSRPHESRKDTPLSGAVRRCRPRRRTCLARCRPASPHHRRTRVISRPHRDRHRRRRRSLSLASFTFHPLTDARIVQQPHFHSRRYSSTSRPLVERHPIHH